MATWLGLVPLATGVASLFIGIGLLRQHNWALILALVFTLLGGTNRIFVIPLAAYTVYVAYRKWAAPPQGRTRSGLASS